MSAFGWNQQATPWSATTCRTTSSIGVDQRSSRFQTCAIGLRAARSDGGRLQPLVGHARQLLADLPQPTADLAVAGELRGGRARRGAACAPEAVGPEVLAADHAWHRGRVEGRQRALGVGLREGAV